MDLTSKIEYSLCNMQHYQVFSTLNIYLFYGFTYQCDICITSFYINKISSLIFQVVGVISVFFIVVSIVSFCIKTHPDMRVPLIKNITVTTSNQTIGWTLDKYETRAHQAFNYIECICNAWFTIEIIFRFVSCPNKFDFLKSR